MMYKVYQLGDKYRCSCQIQDGTEWWETNSLPEAIHSMIEAAQFYNGAVVTKDDILVIPESLVTFHSNSTNSFQIIDMLISKKIPFRIESNGVRLEIFIEELP